MEKQELTGTEVMTGPGARIQNLLGNLYYC